MWRQLAILFTAGTVWAADSSLKLHLDFDLVDSTRVYDVSGNTNHGHIFSTTNSLTYTNAGNNGSTAGEWLLNWTNGTYPNYPVSTYLGVTNLSGISYLTNGTISVWARFFAKPSGGALQIASCLLDAAYDPTYAGGAATNSWQLKRYGGCRALHFHVYPSGSSDSDGVSMIDFDIDSDADTSTPTLKLYTITFDCSTGTYIAYTNGVAQKTNTYTGVPWLRIYNYLCVGAANMGGTPEWLDDNYPNDRFHYGQMDDLRIYNRVLSASEVLALYTAPAGATYYVATNGNNSNIGSQEEPWLTISNAAYVMQPGDTVIVGGGTFDERVSTVRAGTATAPICFRGSGETYMNGFYVNHANQIMGGFLIDGRVTGYDVPMWAGIFYLSANAHNAIITNNTGCNYGTNRASVMWITGGDSPDESATNSFVHGNYFYDVAGTIFTVYGKGHRICCNTISNSLQGIEGCFYLWGQDHVISNNVIRSMNEGGGAHPDIFQTFSQDGASPAQYDSCSNIICGNQFIDMQMQLCHLVSYSSNGASINIGAWKFWNNIFVNVLYYGQVQIPYTEWYNNLFYKCPPLPDGDHVSNGNSALGFYSGGADEPWNTGHSTTFKNNAFILCGTNTATVNRGFYMRDALATNCVFDYNFVTGTNWSTKTTFTEANGVNGGNPYLVDADNNDFRTTTNSVQYAAGINLSSIFTTDIAGTTRPVGAWTIGPYEAGDAPASQPATVRASTVRAGRVTLR